VCRVCNLKQNTKAVLPAKKLPQNIPFCGSFYCLLQSVDAACDKVVFCDEHGAGSVFAKATTGQGVLKINKSNLSRRDEYGVSRTEDRRAWSPKNRLQPPSAKHERRGGSPAAAGRFFGV
jgi:hypothetical protein